MKTLLYLIGAIIIGYLLYVIYKLYIKMNISQNGIAFIEGLEGVRYTAYNDTEGNPTIGVGHLILPTEQYLLTATLTPAQVDALLKADLQRFVNAANQAITVPLKQNQFDAIISILFNIGTGWANPSSEASFIQLIDATGSIGSKFNTSMTQIAQDIMKFDQPPSIITRRAKEARLFVEGNYNVSDTTDLQTYINMTA